MDVKSWLSETGIKTQETLFIKSPPYPYMVFFDRQTHGGADIKNLIVTHDVTVELYTDRADRESEKKIESLLYENGIEFETNSREFIQSENHYMKVYDLTLIEVKGE